MTLFARMEGELMRIAMEPLLNKYGVDMVLAGHVHSYERTLPVYNGTVDPCGAIYLNIGDGGNYEGVYTDWRAAEDWTAFREASFGVAEFSIKNATHTKFAWNRHACQSDSPGYPNYNINFSSTCVTTGDTSAQAMLSTDVAWIIKPSKDECPNRYVSTASPDATPASSGSDSSSTTSLSGLEITLAFFTALFGVSTIVLAFLLYSNKPPHEPGLLSSSSVNRV